MAGLDAVLKKNPLHRTACKRKSSLEVFTSSLVFPASKLKLSQCRVEEGIIGKPFTIRNFLKLYDSTVQSLALPDGDGALRGRGATAQGSGAGPLARVSSVLRARGKSIRMVSGQVFRAYGGIARLRAESGHRSPGSSAFG